MEAEEGDPNNVIASFQKAQSLKEGTKANQGRDPSRERTDVQRDRFRGTRERRSHLHALHRPHMNQMNAKVMAASTAYSTTGAYRSMSV